MVTNKSLLDYRREVGSALPAVAFTVPACQAWSQVFDWSMSTLLGTTCGTVLLFDRIAKAQLRECGAWTAFVVAQMQAALSGIAPTTIAGETPMRRALVAGAGTPLGAFVCDYLAGNGYSVLALFASSSCPPLGRAVKSMTCNEFSLDDCQRVSMAVQQDFGMLDVLVICSEQPQGHGEDMMVSAGVLDANLDRVFNITRSFLRVMGEDGNGRIVTILPAPADDAAQRTCATTTRAALSGFARSLANLLAEEGVTVNTISLVGSERIPDLKLQSRAHVSQSRRADSDDVRIADALTYLISDAGSAVTGADILV
jgi:NAD(P)-dependent dehydrogenase (short-subunit alcohol dehydrogenase family)